MKHIRKQRQGLEFQLCIKPRERFKANKSHEAGSFLLGVAFSFILATTQSFANPEGGRVVAGSATIQQTTAGRLDVLQNSHKAIIDWRGFSIQNGEHTHFQQPNTSSMTLNRVTGGQSSVIHGNLSANGNVFLLNPNGVLFGKNSKVNVGGLIATTSQIDNDDFMAGSFSFDKGSDKLSAAVINRGQIKVTDGGTVVLAASSVSNEGLINARLGQVVLAGTESFTLDFNGDGLLQFNLGEKTQLDSSAKQTENVPVTNSGIVMADGGVVQMTTHVANTVVDHVINMEGVIQARAVDVQGGTIILSGGESGIVAVSGTLDVSGAAPGQTGGVVKVLGDKVGLFDGTEIDASGDAGGGTVLVGGNYQGKGQEPKARRTIVAENTMINADALTDGDGGTVVLWSDEITAFSGEISAKAGLNGGDGGLVEVSGKQELIFRGQVDLNSAHGLNGSLLLDPLNIVISSQPQLNNDNELNDNQILAGDSPGTSFTISEQTVETLSADANIILEATNDITISNLSDDILAFQSTTGSVTFSADADNDGNGTFSLSDIELQTQGGNLTINAANIVEQGISSEIITNGGDISLISSDLFDMRFLFLDSSSSDVGGNINVQASSNVVLTGRGLNIDSSGSSQGGNVSLTSNTGFVDIGRVDASSAAGIGGQININALSDISTGSLTSTGVTAGGDVTLFSATGNIDTAFATEGPPLNSINTFATAGPGGDVVISASGLIDIGGINTSGSSSSNGGNINFTANEINLSADLVSTGGTLLFQPSSPFQNIVIGGEFDSDLALDITASDLSFITGSFESLTIGRDNGSGRILIDPAGVSFNQTTTLRSPITGGSTVIDGAIQSNGNDLTLIAGSNVDVNANVTTAGGNLDINSGGSIDSIAVINTGSSNETAGAVNIEAAANITVADIQTNSVNGVSNIINISSTGGSIDTTAGKLASFAENAGDAAAITLNAEGDINVADVSASALNGDGGNITLISQNGEINTAELNTISVPANAGDIRVEAQGNINTDNVFASALNNDNNSSETADTGNAGNITLISNNGDIATAGLLAPASAITGSAGDGGVISVSADNGKVSVDGVVWAFSEAENNTGSGGSINFTAKNDIQILSEGSTNFGVVQSSSKSESGTAGNGGDVSFKTSEGGLIIEDDISTVARGLNASGNGGNVDISTAGNVDITTINTSSEGISDGGDVNISAGSALTFDNIVTSNQSVGLSSRTGNGGDVNIFAATDLVLKRINTSAEEALNGGDISVSISSGDLTVDQNVVAGNGNINFSASDNVVFTNDFESLGNISVTADSISLHDVTTNGSQTYTGSVAFNSDYKTGGEDFTVNGPSVLLSPTSINTNGGAITFNGEVNGSNDLTLLAGNSGDILFREDVGVSTPLGLIDIQSANNVNVFGQMFARQLNVVYQGSFTTDPAGFLDVGGLFLSSEAQSASLAGIVNGAAGEDTALLVEGPVGNSNFTINGCVIGVSCNEEPEIPVVVEPRPTPNINADILTESSTTETPAVVAVAQRSSPSDDPNQYQFSNLGNEELWDNNPGGYSVSSFAAFTVSSPEDREKKDEEKGEE